MKLFSKKLFSKVTNTYSKQQLKQIHIIQGTIMEHVGVRYRGLVRKLLQY